MKDKKWRFIAVLCVSGLSIVSSARWIFGYNHYIAILIGFVAFLASLYTAYHDDIISGRVFISLSIVALLFGLGLAYYIGPNFPEETATHGWL
jgi:hypothetical protein